MKKQILFLLLLCSISRNGIAQVDSLAKPVFHSIVLKVDTLNDCIVYTNYYTIRNNIDNKNSAVYVTANPSLDELINFACTKPSYSFLVLANHTIANMIVMEPRVDAKHMTYTYVITNSNSGKKAEIVSKTIGAISELRSAELLRNAYDKEARALQNGSDKFCLFGEKYYSIQSFQSVREEVLNILTKYNLSNPNLDLETLNK